MKARSGALALALMAVVTPARGSGTEAHRALMVSGQMLRSDGKLLRARELLTECTSRPCDADADAECSAIRTFCATQLDELARELPSVRVVVTDDLGRPLPRALVRIDSLVVAVDTAVALDPGRYVLRAEHLGRTTTVEFQATAPPTATVRAVIDLRTSRVDRPIPWTAWGLGGVAAVAFAGAGIFGAVASHDRNAFAPCEPTCDPSLRPGYERTLAATDISLGIGLLASLGAVALYLVRPQVAHALRLDDPLSDR